MTIWLDVELYLLQQQMNSDGESSPEIVISMVICQVATFPSGQWLPVPMCLDDSSQILRYARSPRSLLRRVI